MRKGLPLPMGRPLVRGWVVVGGGGSIPIIKYAKKIDRGQIKIYLFPIYLFNFIFLFAPKQ